MDRYDDDHRLRPDEVSGLCSLLKGRVGHRGHFALAKEAGISVQALRKIISRVPVSPGEIRKVRAHLAGLSTSNDPR